MLANAFKVKSRAYVLTHIYPGKYNSNKFQRQQSLQQRQALEKTFQENLRLKATKRY